MKRRWFALGIMLTVQTIGSLTFLSITTLTPFIQNRFELSSSSVGLLINVLYLGYFLTLIPSGVLTDVFGERLILSLGLGLLGIFSVAIGIGTQIWIIGLCLFALGCGYSTIGPGTNKGIYDWFPTRELGTGLGIKQTGVMIGGAIGAALLPVVATNTDWQVAFSIVGSVSILSITFLVMYSHPADTDNDQYNSDRSAIQVFQSQAQDLVDVYKATELSPLLLVGFLFGAGQFTLMAYIMLYFTEQITLTLATAGLLYSLMQFSGVISRISFGYIADNWFPRNKHRLLFFIGIIAAIAYIALLLLSATASLLPLVAIVMLLGSMALGYNGVYLTMANEIVGSNHTGASTSIAITAVMFGALVTPPVFGLIVDVTESYTVSMGLLTMITLFAGIFSVRIDTTSKQNLD